MRKLEWWKFLAVLASGVVSLAPVANRGYTAGSFQLQIDGTQVGVVQSAAGGAAYAEVVPQIVGAQNSVKKQLGNVRYEPLRLEYAGAEANLLDWLDASLGGTPTSKNLTLLECSPDYKALTERSFANAQVGQIAFPALEAGGKVAFTLGLELLPESSNKRKAGGACSSPAATKQMLPIASNFRVDLDNVDTSGVARVEAFTVKHTYATENVGETRHAVASAAKTEVPNLHLKVAASKATSFEDWHADFVVRGNNADSKEKSGALVLLSQDFKEELLRISLHNVGIVRVTPHADPGFVQVELYLEQLRLSYPGKAKAVKASAAKASAAKVAPVRAQTKTK